MRPEGPNPNQPPLTQSSGPNNLQNYPVLNVATINPDNVSEERVAGTFESTASTYYTLQFFAGSQSEFSDGTRDDDAEQLVLSAIVQTNASGIVFFDFPLPDGSVQIGSVLRATACDSIGNTSEFSNAVTVQVCTDGSGIPDAVEAANAAAAGVPDSTQANVVTVQDAVSSTSYVTLSAPDGISFTNVLSEVNPSPVDAPVQTEFGFGFFSFDLTGLTDGQHVAVQMTLPAAAAGATQYWHIRSHAD